MWLKVLLFQGAYLPPCVVLPRHIPESRSISWGILEPLRSPCKVTWLATSDSHVLSLWRRSAQLVQGRILS